MFKLNTFVSLCLLFPIFLSGQETFRAVLEPRLSTELSGKVNTTVEVLHKRMGDSFEEGERLVTLDDRIFRSNYEEAKAGSESALALFEAQERLFQDGVTSFVERSQAKAAYAKAQADLVFAEEELNACTLKAPYAGRVQELHVQEHEWVEPGRILIDILDDSILLAKLLIPSKLLPRVSIGQKVEIELPQIQRVVHAEITHISPAIDPSSSLVKVDARIDNSDHQLRAGMVGKLTLSSKGRGR